ncbi:MAG: NAD(P)/FAD-dependent oxidoreductase [Pseudobdellovibrionaceae bacterium]
MSTSFWLDRSSKKPTAQYDAVVVGAGISGLSVAYWLKKEDPNLKVAVIEKSRIGFGASGRNAGFITCGSVEHFNRLISKHGKDEAVEIWKFSETNLKLLEENIIQGAEGALQFEKKGAYSLAAQENEFKELKNVAEIMSGLNIPVELVEGAGIEKRLGATGFVGGIRYLDDASVHPIRMLELMREKTKADFFEQTEMFGYEETSDGMRLVKTDNGNFETPMIIYALNGYSPAAHPYFADKIYPTRGQILMMEAVPAFMDGPCYANFYLDYFRQLPSGELLIGGFRQIEKETEVGYSDHTTSVIQQALHHFVVTHLPSYTDKKVTHRWGGVMGFSKDGQPMVGSLPEDPQVFFCGGYTGHGIGLAFNTGKHLVDLIYGRPIPKWLSSRRFH